MASGSFFRKTLAGATAALSLMGAGLPAAAHTTQVASTASATSTALSPSVTSQGRAHSLRTNAISPEQLGSAFTNFVNHALHVVPVQGSLASLGLEVAQYNADFSSAPKAFAMLTGDPSNFHPALSAHGAVKPLNTGYGNAMVAAFNQG